MKMVKKSRVACFFKKKEIWYYQITSLYLYKQKTIANLKCFNKVKEEILKYVNQINESKPYCIVLYKTKRRLNSPIEDRIVFPL